MINYDRDVNRCDIAVRAAVMTIVLTTGDNYKEVYPTVVEAEQWVHSILYFHKNKDMAKLIKSNWKADISEFITKGIDKVQDRYMKKILSSSLPYDEKLNVAMSVARWPEFYLYSEKDLRRIGTDIKSHINEINAITFYDEKGRRICPYNPNSYHNDLDWEGTLRSQEINVKDFLNANNISSEVNAEWIIEEIHRLFNDIVSDKPIDTFDKLERGFIESVREIRRHAADIDDWIHAYRAGKAIAEQFGLSESKSPISNLESVMQTLHSLGFNKATCPMVVANMFHGEYPTLEISIQDGQVQINGYNAEGFEVAPGLGPAYKIRFVFNTDANIQNSIAGYAMQIQKADRAFDPMEAYNQQMERLQLDLADIVDAFCVDVTGYSDYLTRCIYTILMMMHGVNNETLEYVLKVFRMPLVIDGDRYEVPFGSMQGCKLLVFIMNHANRLIGILAHRFNKARTDCRCNAGDDVETHSLKEYYNESDIADELAMFAYFNCPSNAQKTAWLKRDGYFDFCSKYYAKTPKPDNFKGIDKGVFSITGLPPKIAGKEILSINSFAEIFKVLDIAKTKHRSCIESWELLKDLLKPELLDGLKLPAANGIKYTLEDKIKLAKLYPYSVGGLADEDSTSVESKLAMLHYKTLQILERYTFDPSGLFMILRNMDEEFQSTELFKALGTVSRQSMKDIAKVIVILNTSKDEIDEDDISWAIGQINRFERNIIKGESISRSNSTYHRKTPLKDLDMFAPMDQVENDYLEAETIPMTEDLMQASILLCSMADNNFVDIDNIRRYISLRELYKKHADKLVKYNHGPCSPYYAIDEGDGLKVRLESDPWSTYGYYESFKHPEDIRDPEIKQLWYSLRETGSFSLYQQLEKSVNLSLQSSLDIILHNQLENLTNQQLSTCLRTLLPGAIDL